MEPLFREEELIKGLGMQKYGFVGRWAVKFLSKITHLEWINAFYLRMATHGRGIEFLDYSLKDLNIQLDISDEDLNKIPKDGPFISISNHPFGLLDGIIIIYLMGKIRPDFRVMANYMLERLRTIDEFFISVDPFEGEKQTSNSLQGVKKTLLHVQAGGAVGIFPAGEVSTQAKGSPYSEDREWQAAAIRILQKSNAPVLPVFFEGSNSPMFHSLGRIHPLLRTSRLVTEFYNKQNTVIRIKIGDAIHPSSFPQTKNVKELGEFFRSKTYALRERK